MTDDLTVREKELRSAIRFLAGDQRGQRFLRFLMEVTGVHGDAFAGDSQNATNYYLGRQSVCREVIAKMIAIDETLYPKLLLSFKELSDIDNAAEGGGAKEEEDNDDAYA